MYGKPAELFLQIIRSEQLIGGAIGEPVGEFENIGFTGGLTQAGDLRTGDDGLIEHSSDDEAAYREWTKEAKTVESPHERGGYRRELESFVSALEFGTEPAVGTEDAVDSLRLALAAERSAASGEPVEPNEVAP